jgi:hypothetical protein
MSFLKTGGYMDRVASAKIATQNMLMYYFQALIEVGCEDPKRELATELPKMIKLSEDQTKFVLAEYSNSINAEEMIKSMLILVAEMDKEKKYLKENTTLLKKGLETLYNIVKSGDKNE